MTRNGVFGEKAKWKKGGANPNALRKIGFENTARGMPRKKRRCLSEKR